MWMYGQNRGRAVFVAGALALLLLGCGGSEGPGGGGDASVAPAGSGTLTWLDDGKKHSALSASGARVLSAMNDLVMVSGGEASGIGISFGISTPPPLAPGSYPCGISGTRTIVSFSYTGVGTYQSCTVTLTSIGAKSGDRVAGTFSATFPTKVLTSGVFDVPLIVNSL
jgi:hypothetical protein